MTLAELIERLEELRESLGDEVEVRLMTQQQWPFENAICGVTTSHAIAQCDDDEDYTDDDNESTVFLVEGKQLCYGSKLAWETI